MAGRRRHQEVLGARAPRAQALASLGGRKRLASSSSTSRGLSAVEFERLRECTSWLLTEAPEVDEVLLHPAVLTYDAVGTGWHVFDYDATVTTLRHRALPTGDDLPEPVRRSAAMAAPGYSGRKRGAAAHAVRSAARGRWAGGWGGLGGEWGASGTIWTPTLSTELPLFHAGGDAVAEAVAGYQLAAADLLRVQADARSELDTVGLRLSVGRARLADVEAALAEAERAEAAAEARLSAGAGDPLERLDAVVAATSWRLARVELLDVLRQTR